MDFFHYSLNKLFELFSIISAGASLAEQRRLNALMEQVKQGNAEVEKDLRQEMQRIHDRQAIEYNQYKQEPQLQQPTNQGYQLSHKPAQTTPSREYNYHNSGSSSALQICHNPPQSQANYSNQLQLCCQQQPPSAPAYGIPQSGYSPNHGKPSKAQLGKNIQNTTNQLTAELLKMPSVSMPSQAIAMQRPVYQYKAPEKFQAKNVAKDITVDLEKNARLQQKEQISWEKLQKRQPPISYPKATEFVQEEMPTITSNVDNFANELSSILKKHEKTYPITTEILHDSKPQLHERQPKKQELAQKLPDKKMNFEQKSETSPLIIKPENHKIAIGVMGLNDSGKSHLISALTGISSVILKNQNFVEFGKDVLFYKIDHPNYGFVDNEPNAMKTKCRNYLEQIQARNLSCLLNVISGNMREEDIFVLQLVMEMNIPVAIIRSKSDEWLDGCLDGITEASKKAFAEKETNYIRTVAKNIDETIARCPIYNVSARAISNISKNTKQSKDWQKYLIDELGMIQYLENFGCNFTSVKISLGQFVDKNQEKIATPSVKSKMMQSDDSLRPSKHSKKGDILFVGRFGAGKTAICNILKESMNFESAELGYQEPMQFSKIIDKMKAFDLHNLKQLFVVIGDAVGEIDAHIVKYAADQNIPFSVLLTKSDEHIDAKTEYQKFSQDDVYKYKQQRLSSAQLEFAKLTTKPLRIFVISSRVLKNKINNQGKFLEYTIDENDFLQYFNQHLS